MDLPTYDKFLNIKQDKDQADGNRNLNAITRINIQAPYPDKYNIGLDYPKGGISSLKVDFTQLNFISYDSPNPLGQTISSDATDTQLTGASFNMKLDSDNFIILFSEIYFQLTGANAAAHVQFFFKVDGVKHKAGSYDDGDTNVPGGTAIISSRLIHDIFILKQGQHNIQIFGRYDQTRNAPNLAVNYFRYSFLPLGN